MSLNFCPETDYLIEVFHGFPQFIHPSIFQNDDEVCVKQHHNELRMVLEILIFCSG
jgi:hypothetical protein